MFLLALIHQINTDYEEKTNERDASACLVAGGRIFGDRVYQ